MYQTFQLSLGVLYAFIGVCLSQPPCIYPLCICSDGQIFCEDNRLTSIPTIVPSTAHYDSLNFDMNSITDIPAGSLPPNVTEIMFTNNPITTIADTAFDDSAFTLDTIYLSLVEFTKIPDAFSHLKALKYLSIEEANIQDWNEEAMRNIGQTLASLVLDNVGMTSWPTWLKYFSHLTDLTFSRGSISTVPDDALANMTNTLTNLALFSNKLTTVPKAFSQLTALENLNIQQNRIVDVSWVPQNSKLTTLSLSNNLISDANLLSNALRPLGDTLNYLYINSNRLSALPDFSFLNQVRSLDLTDNRLIYYNSGAFDPSIISIILAHNFFPAIPDVLKTLPSLYGFTLSYNSITQIRASDFSNLTTTVELGYNLITELTENCFPENSTISSLQLNNNPITTISISAFKNLVQLAELNLQGSRLLRLPLALGSLTSVYSVDMSNTATLLCTCLEKSLATWVLSKERYAIGGSCGVTDIYTFFSKLSPSCP